MIDFLNLIQHARVQLLGSDRFRKNVLLQRVAETKICPRSFDGSYNEPTAERPKHLSNVNRAMLRFVAIFVGLTTVVCRSETWIEAPTELDLFQGSPCELVWNVHAVPSSNVVVTGQVFQISSTIAAPLPGLSFEAKTSIPAGKISTEIRHRFELPPVKRPASFLVQWQSGERNGKTMIRVFPSPILPDYPSVVVDEGEDLNPIRESLKADHGSLSSEWKGIRFTKAKSSGEVSALRMQNLLAGQSHVIFADLPGLPGTVMAKHAGAGRVIFAPTSFIKRFPSSPIVQQTILELSKP